MVRNTSFTFGRAINQNLKVRMAATHHQASTSSSSSGSISTTYEVFLSFHGEDVRKKIADHLYHDLVNVGIRTFRDSEELRMGNEIGPELLTAIQESSISIPIFSENYARSQWYLNELTQISECRGTRDQIVLPIFYKVEPRDVRNQKNKYEEAFEEHLPKDFHKIQKWKKALREVGGLKGWHVQEETYEGELIKEVVNEVRSELNKRRSSVSNKNLVGIQSHIEEMLKLLDIESDDRTIVGIRGLGGIGKTTIARAVYYEIFNLFEGHCSFIANVRESAKQYDGLIRLQKQLVSNILKQEDEVIDSVEDGISVIQQRFRAKKVLIVLDDVDQDDQAKSLVGDLEWFGVGSKIIITCRNKDILTARNGAKIYEPKEMDSGDSLQLFSHHAFGRDQPLKDHLDLSKAIVNTTGGLPLALQVIGSYLFKKEKSVWEGMLKKLQEIPHPNVMKTLKISYDGLEYAEQQMFLDTACFFIGMDKDIACHIWEGCNFFPKVGLDALCVKSLVMIDEKNELRMHNQLRDLGREIVRQENKDEPGERSRIWSQKEVLTVINAKKGTSNVKGLIIDFRHISMSQCLMNKGLSAMTDLRLLQVDYAESFGNFTNSFSELRWLSWRGCPDQYALTNFCPQKLVVLDLSHSKITNNWMGWNYIKKATNLKVLNLTSCHQLSSTPDFSANQLLEVLILKGCRNLDEIDTSICCLTNLVILDMGECKTLKGLPSENFQLTSLKSLILTKCSSLTSLDFRRCSTSFRYISSGLPSSSLSSLDVSWCTSIRYISGLPSSLIELDASECKSMVKLSSTSGGLKNLKTLSLYGCKSLEEIEGVDEKLDSLEDFNIEGCNSLRKLPKLSGSKNLTTLKLFENNLISDFESDGMDSLEELYIWKCKSLRKIAYLRDSKRLRILKIRDCPELSEIECLENYESLQRLSIIKATSLKSLPEDILTGMNNLSYLRISGCFLMERLPRLSNLKELRQLHIGDCGDCGGIEDWESLKEILGLDRLESMRELEIAGCIGIQRLPDLSNLNKLTSLCIRGCKNLTEEIHGINRLKNLEVFVISGCESLERLPDLSKLKNLTKLSINGCKKLTEIQVSNGLEYLEDLDVSGCISLERLPGLSNMKNLTKLSTNGCKNLTKLSTNGCKKLIEIQASNGVESLEYLDVSGCISLERLPDLSNSKNLLNLSANGCKKLTEIQASNGLECLEYLDVSGCIYLERLPGLSNLKNLTKLFANCCKKLTEIQASNGLDCLKCLDVSGCISLERLPDLLNSKNLMNLSANGCKKLTEIQASNGLESLEFLDVSGCISLERLPNLSNSKNLMNLSANGCKKLTEIQASNGLESLEYLDVSGCISLERLLGLSNLKNLTKLSANGCKKLAEIQASNGLDCLKYLDVSGCISLERLPDLSNSKNLMNLSANGCKKLTEIQASNGLESLEYLDVSGCISLERLLDLSNSKNLMVLSTNGCKKLTY